MTHRESRDHNRNRSSDRNLLGRLRDRRRRKDRQLLHRQLSDRHLISETLEQRQLLAGPDLIGIQPNEGSLINGGETLNVSPREIVFRFDDSTELDPLTLDGIRISRAGEDGVFESASATSDLGSEGQALVEFRAIQTVLSAMASKSILFLASRPVRYQASRLANGSLRSKSVTMLPIQHACKI